MKLQDFIEKIFAEKDAKISQLEEDIKEALRGNRYAQLEIIATKRAEKAENKISEIEKIMEGWREGDSADHYNTLRDLSQMMGIEE